MTTNPTLMCERLVGLDFVTVLRVEDWPCFAPLRVHIETRLPRPACVGCGAAGWVKDRARVELVDLPAFGRPARLVWHKVRWCCPNDSCAVLSWTGQAPWIASARVVLTDRAGRWATVQVGRHARTVAEVAGELGCDWHTVMDAVVAYGEALIDDDPDRIGATDAVGLDEALMGRAGPFRRQRWSTQVTDVRAGQLLDVIEGRDAATACDWFANQDPGWLAGIGWATLDLSGPYRTVFDTILPHAQQVAFHVVKLANQALDDVRRRVQQDTLGHRGRKPDPLYRSRRLLVMADERLADHRRDRLTGLLDAGDPRGEVRTAWHAKEVVRSIYDHTNPPLATEFVTRLGTDLQAEDCPAEINRLGRTISRWRDQICAWHHAHVTNAPTEALNNLVKRVKRAAFGLTRFRHYRIRALLYAGQPNWDLLPTITPR